MFVSVEDQKLDVPEQRTEKWFAQRKNRLTGSRLSEFNFIDSEERLRKYYDIIWNGAKREPFTEEQKGWMAYGVENEPIATDDFCKHFSDYILLECPFDPHTKTDWLGASPDGRYFKVEDGQVTETGIVEIKCPAKTRRPYPKVKNYYVSQMYLEMACTGERKAIFISWGPRCMRAWKLEWSETYWQALSNVLHAFRRKDLSYDVFLELQNTLLIEQEKVVKNAICMHPGKGIKISG